jgi:trk system potassium uptake protein TrkH
MPGVARLIALLVMVLAGATSLGLLVAFVEGVPDLVESFAMTLLVTAFGGALVWFALSGRDERLSRRHLMALVVVAWPVLGGLASIPFLAVAADPIASLFEGVSSFTTTGASNLGAAADLPRSLIFWRALLQWMGGGLTLVFAVMVAAPLGLGGLPQRPTPQVDDLTGAARLVKAAAFALPVYCAASLACFAALSLSGVTPFIALSTALATISTGGLLPVDGGVSAIGSAAAPTILAVTMVIGATSPFWHRQIVSGQWRAVKANREGFALIALAVLTGLAILTLEIAHGGATGNSIENSLFLGFSILTSTGIAVDPTQLALLPLGIVLVAAFIGGASFSASGGLSLLRAGALMTQARREFLRLIHPHSVRSAKFGGTQDDIQVMKAIWAVFASTIFVLALLSLAIAAGGAPFEAALSLATFSLANVGPLYPSASSISEGWPIIAELHGGAKLAMIAGMLIGRIETLTLLVVAYLAYWRP